MKLWVKIAATIMLAHGAPVVTRLCFWFRDGHCWLTNWLTDWEASGLAGTIHARERKSELTSELFSDKIVFS